MFELQNAPLWELAVAIGGQYPGDVDRSSGFRFLAVRLRLSAPRCWTSPNPAERPKTHGGLRPDSGLSSPYTSTPLRKPDANRSTSSLLRCAPFRSLKHRRQACVILAVLARSSVSNTERLAVRDLNKLSAPDAPL